MDDVTPTKERRQATPIRREIAWGIAIPAATLGLSLATWLGDWSMGIQHQLSVHESRLSSFDRYIEEHRRDADQWVSRIRENESGCDECKRDVAALKSRSSARADPFTGTEGAELKSRLTAIEAAIRGLHSQ